MWCAVPTVAAEAVYGQQSGHCRLHADGSRHSRGEEVYCASAEGASPSVSRSCCFALTRRRRPWQTIKAAKCNVLLVQKSILRDAITDLSLHFLAKAKIMVVKDVERADIEFICKTLHCRPVAHPDSFSADHLGMADTVETISIGEEKARAISWRAVVKWLSNGPRAVDQVFGRQEQGQDGDDSGARLQRARAGRGRALNPRRVVRRALSGELRMAACAFRARAR